MNDQIKYCEKCGSEIEQNSHFCPKCGAEIKQQNVSEPAPSYAPTYNTQSNAYNQQQAGYVDKKYFFKHLLDSTIRSSIVTAAVVCFILGALNIINVINYGFVSLIDMVVFLGCGFGILLAQSRACAVVAPAYYAIGQLIMALSGQVPVASTAIAIALCCCLVWGAIGTFKCKREYDAYMASTN